MWTRDEAIWVVEKLEPKLAEMGAHCALAGSILYRGTSDKDLDLVIYPHQSDGNGSHWDTYPIKQMLAKFFQSGTFNDCSGVSQIRDGKEVAWLKTPKAKRVDFFFLK